MNGVNIFISDYPSNTFLMTVRVKNVFYMSLCPFRDSIYQMANYVIAIAIIVGIICGPALSVMEDADKNLLGLIYPHGRRLDSELQLTRLMLAIPRFYHPKRNTELINSLLGLPKNMNNAGK